MKKVLISSFVALFFLACTKSKDVANPVDTIETPDQTTIKPVASFQITNPYNDNGDILEFRTLQFKNTSSNADSYTWDLSSNANYSDGNVDYPLQYSDKKEPVNIYFAPCMQTVTITLTAKNKAGDVSKTSHSYNVQCFRGVGGKHPEKHKLY